jgi:site-specific recombinase XerD
VNLVHLLPYPLQNPPTRLARLLARLEHEISRILVLSADEARTVAVDPSAQAYVERWLARRETLGLNGRHPVFATISKNNHGHPLSATYVRQVLPRLARRAGIEQRIHPHALRHSLATALAYEGKSLPTISGQLGHSSTGVTDRYLRKIAPAELVTQVRDRGRLA